MLQVKALTFNPFAENTYILYVEEGDCVIVDPGCYETAERQELVSFIEHNNLNPKRLLNTHCHVDHVFGNTFVSEKYNLGLEMHEKDLPVLESAEQVARMYGFNIDPQPDPSNFLDEGEQIEIGGSKLDILFCPGHAPGHIVFIDHEQKNIIGGDVLFQGSIGRTDLPGGDHDTLIESIKTKLFPLDDDYTVFSGHGPSTTIGFERAHNPFLQ